MLDCIPWFRFPVFTKKAPKTPFTPPPAPAPLAHEILLTQAVKAPEQKVML